MAAVIGDLVPDVARFRGLLVNPSSLQRPQTHGAPSPRRRSTASSSGGRPTPATPPRPLPRPPPCRPDAPGSAPAALADQQARGPSAAAPRPPPSSSVPAPATPQPDAFIGGPSRIPSPPPSSSPAAVADDEKDPASMASTTQDGALPLARAPHAAPHAAPMSAPPRRQRHQPSPPADDFQIPSSTSHRYPLSDAAHPPAQGPQHQVVVHVRDLAHVQTLAGPRKLGANGPGVAPAPHTKYEISAMPMGDIIEMVAALLTKITTTNDLQHDALQRNAAHQQQASQTTDSPGGSNMSPLSHSVLAFHGKNVPAITILSYLSRIHKYCPTTYEVFLSLLVYFDRMTERVNDMVVKADDATAQSHPSRQDSAMSDDAPPAASDADESDSDLADDDNDEQVANSADAPSRQQSGRVITVPEMQSGAAGPVTCFVVDSFNIHRLIIAGVTCASKFFSDVFYTNSRYAKVGGLPLAELNHLEIQFLVLNDFRLAVPVEDLEAYATMLVEFYAREVIEQRAAPGLGE
ncbi:cyclin domain-containing protein [Hirsutella rhossiliensis]|uniref:Cyclin domain-containing protein n=1 Tax=Hirsutella rhossiliensis TaxID=111463 RepID=A0A9P8MY84_9HYPO|nr:cyclin domain-containing protein [Hirsutella rhossiliensis]KAH0963475.1 cyclin domain-containing protein [Hirsutella rhossiliensis]